MNRISPGWSWCEPVGGFFEGQAGFYRVVDLVFDFEPAFDVKESAKGQLIVFTRGLQNADELHHILRDRAWGYLGGHTHRHSYVVIDGVSHHAQGFAVAGGEAGL